MRRRAGRECYHLEAVSRVSIGDRCFFRGGGGGWVGENIQTRGKYRGKIFFLRRYGRANWLGFDDGDDPIASVIHPCDGHPGLGVACSFIPGRYPRVLTWTDAEFERVRLPLSEPEVWIWSGSYDVEVGECWLSLSTPYVRRI